MRKVKLFERAIDIGAKGELLALAFLKQRGLQLIEKNFNCKPGEIDLIMQDDEYTVFVEVRYRKNSGYGSPLETVDSRKQRKLWLAAQTYLQQKGLSFHVACRFDVVAITGLKDYQYEWVKDAFRG